MSDVNTTTSPKSKKVKAVRAIKVGDPYYFFILKTESGFIIDDTFISMQFATEVSLEHPHAVQIPMQKKECKIRNITEYHFCAEFPYGGYPNEFEKMLSAGVIDVTLNYFGENAQGKKGIIPTTSEKVPCTFHDYKEDA